MRTTDTADALPETTISSCPVEVAATASFMKEKAVKLLRLSDYKSGKRIPMLSGKTGRPAVVTLKDLNNHQKRILSNAFDFIEQKLKGTAYEESVKVVMGTVKFVVTVSSHIYAYCAHFDDGALIVMNTKMITGPFKEVAVCILHELLHRVIISDDRDPMSLEEARHDFLCYKLLGLPVRRDHWSFTPYPHLRDECFKNEAESN